MCSTLTPSPANRINTAFQFDIMSIPIPHSLLASCSLHEHTEHKPKTHDTLLQKSPGLPYVKLLLGEYLLSFSDGQNCRCTYLAVLLTSDLSIFTATRTGWWVNSVDETPRNSSRPSASQRCTCGTEGRGNYESVHRQKTRGKQRRIEVTGLVTAGRMTKQLI